MAPHAARRLLSTGSIAGYTSSSIIRAGSAWTAAQIDTFLRQARIPVRLACQGRNATPLICSLWYLYDREAIWCATQAGAQIVSCLERNPYCGFEIAPDDMPYRGVRGQGLATLSRRHGPDILAQLVDRYLGSRESKLASWLLSREAHEVAIRIEPRWLTSWDFAARMQGANRDDQSISIPS